MVTPLSLPPTCAALRERYSHLQSGWGERLPMQSSATHLGLDVLALSDYLERVARVSPEFMAQPTELSGAPFAEITATADEASVMAALRRIRQRELAKIAVRDLLGLDAPEQVLRHISTLADQAIQAAVTWGYAQLARRYGTPVDATHNPLPLVVLGMGKLGGYELNFSSDIDLILLYPSDGDIAHPSGLEHGEFFNKLGQQLIRLLDAPTADGFVYRVDMRLRPFGESGPLVCSFAFLENYLLEQGRDWERYAWIKARAIVGQTVYAELYKEVVRPFVYRRYLDFSVFESLRAMHAKILREVERREWQEHLKLGPGGIREIEFMVQMFQLLRGGSDQRLQSTSLLAVLPLLNGPKMMSAQAVSDLARSYHVLRRAENRLQMIDEQQTHSLPSSALGLERLAVMLGLSDITALSALLQQARAAVTRHFSELVFAHPHAANENRGEVPARASELSDWHQEADAMDWCLAQGLAPTPEQITALWRLRDSGYYRRLAVEGKRRLERLLPSLLAQLPAQAEPTLTRLWRIFEAIGHRITYLSLLYENPKALTRLIDVCALSEFLVEHICASPVLLDELLDERLMTEPPTRQDFAEDVRLKCLDPPDDEEHWLERLREFQKTATFRVALWDLMGKLPLMLVSDRLTDIAELLIQHVLDYAWNELTQLLGVPHEPDGRACAVSVIAYGKLAGREMGYDSDLDLVFLHDGVSVEGETRGPTAIDNGVFFVRLAQKIIHLLTTYSRAGRLYEVDMRLRPSGRFGLLMSSFTAFADYQRAEAWTYEHQALLHSRAVAGAYSLQERFEQLRLTLLTSAIRWDGVKTDVVSMRERMRAQLSRSSNGQFDLKYDLGGMGDIEFLAQYYVLAHARDYPPLATYSDTIRQLESLASINLLAQSTADVLVQAYQAYRQARHHRSLNQQDELLPASEFMGLRQQVMAIWAETFA
jgi:[glutamine synthetase] adenylyltransferase / [glutamine synthetase]-adenylyl-L-tyrosine phosphorylase